jgi:thioredoxin-like negative regulator of GroEL
VKLVYFYKDNCAPCAAKKPLVKELALVTGKELELVDTMDPANAERVAAFKVRSVPALCVEEDGKRLVGFTSGMIQRATVLSFLGHTTI